MNSNNYKENNTLRNMINKRGQIAIFIIVAVVIVAVVLIIFLFPQVTEVFVTQDLNPTAFLSKCIEPVILEGIELTSKQGGYLEPDNYVMYQGEKIQYLCYTSENYKPCVVQQPLIKEKMENELEFFVEPVARQCVSDLEEEYERRGFNVDTKPGDVDVKIEPQKIIVDFLSPMTVSKESTQTFRKFAIGINSEIYDLVLTATSIIQFESALGDSSIEEYIQYYPDLKIEKIKREGDTIYKLSNVITEESFTFASRSLVWPPGYGFVDLENE